MAWSDCCIHLRGIAKHRFPRYNLSPRLRVSIDLSLLGKYFGEISKIRIKKSTLPYVVSMLYPIHSFAVSFYIILTFPAVPNTSGWGCQHVP